MAKRTKSQIQNPKVKILGLELAGGKSNRTACLLLDYFPKQNKIFVSEFIRHVQATEANSGDEVLLESISRLSPDWISVNTALSLPPCNPCPTSPKCNSFRSCKHKPVRWMYEEAVRAKIPPAKYPTPYTQRPLDVYLRTRIQPHYPLDLFLEETMGSGRAPLTLRMHYLKRFLKKTPLLEVHPRLALMGLASWYGFSVRDLRRYRMPEDGIEHRLAIIDKLQSNLTRFTIPQLFLYKADELEIAKELSGFYALVSAMMVVFRYCNLLEKAENDFNPKWGFVAFPKLNKN